MNKKAKTYKGTVEVEIEGVKYAGIIDLKAVKQDPVFIFTNYPIFGVRIDRKNSDPEKAVEYIGAATGFSPATPFGAGSWADVYPFNQIKPCVLRNDGEVEDYLNPNNYGEWHNGGKVDISDLDGADVMVEFPKVFYRIKQDDKYIYVEITASEESLKDGFTDFAFSYKGKVSDKFYVGAYKGYIQNGKLRSLSDRIPTGDKTIGAFRKAAQTNGKGYEIMAFNKLTLLQVLYLIRFKSLNSQAALGAGLTESRNFGTTGATDSDGLYWGEKSPRSRVKCHGIEDFWGNIWEWVDGFIITQNQIKISDGNFNDSGDGYEVAGQLGQSVSGWITDIRGDNKLGFIPAETNSEGNSETFYGDYGWLYSSNSGYLPIFGGYRNDGASAGAFYFICYYSASYSSSNIGARLLFMGVE